MPTELTQDLKFAKNPQEFCAKLSLLWNVDKDGMSDFYSQIINSSPVMQDALEQILDELIAEGVRAYKIDFDYDHKSEEDKKKIDDKLQRKVKLMKELSFAYLPESET